VDHVLVLFGVAAHVAHVPTQSLEEGINELDTHVGFFVVGALVGVQVMGKALNQTFDLDFGLAAIGFSHLRLLLVSL
jgi:hypothetical protein